MSDGCAKLPALSAGKTYSLTRTDDGLQLRTTGGGRHVAETTLTIDEGSLGTFGPAVISPFRHSSAGLWLLERFGESAEMAAWTIVCEGGTSLNIEIRRSQATLTVLGTLRDTASAKFRHDVRGLANTIGINADLAQMMSASDGLDRLAEVVRRIKINADSLAKLVSRGDDEAQPDRRCAMMPALEYLLDRAGAADGITFDGEDTTQVSEPYCAAVAQLFGEWTAWLARSLDAADGTAAPLRAYLSVRSGAAELRTPAVRLRPEAEAFCPWYTGDAAPPGLPTIGPAETLRGEGVGVGAWQALGGAGVCAGIPRS